MPLPSEAPAIESTDAVDPVEEEYTRRYLLRKPKALQWFYNGQLQKASEGERQAGRFELFLDLLYVALVANFAETLAENPSGSALVKYILIFSPAWHAWSDLKELMNSYFNDDLLQRVLILWIMALLVVYGNNAPLVDEDIGALRTTVGVYMVARLTSIFIYTIYSFASHEHRPQVRFYAILNSLGLCIWIPLYFEEVSIEAKIAVTVVAIVYEEVSWATAYGPWIKKRLNLEYSTAVDAAHEIDRHSAFYIIILGEFVYGIVVGSPAAIGFQTGTLRAVWTLVIAFCLNWLYVNEDGSIKSVHPLRRAVWSSFFWFLLHQPLSMSLLISGHMCAVSVSAEELTMGEKWLLCGGLGAGMFFLWLLSLAFKSEDQWGRLYIPKVVRMAARLVIAIIISVLPLAEELDPTKLMSIIAGLIAFVVVWETVGSLERGAAIYEK